MRILLTGYGKLGKALCEQLGPAHEVKIFQRSPADTDLPQVNADISSYTDVYRAMEAIDAVIHTAAQQAGRWDTGQYETFFDANVKGTHNVLQAALERGIKRLALSSSIVVCGVLSRGGPDDRSRAARIDENIPPRPENIYDLSKVVNEQMAEFYARVHGMSVCCLRYGGFFAPHEGADHVRNLLSWFVHTEDVAQATCLALTNAPKGYSVYVVMPRIRFTDEDRDELVTNPNAVILRRYPEESEIAREKGLEFGPIPMWWDSAKAQRELGFCPRYNFENEIRRCL